MAGNASRWNSNVSGKSVEIQRSQVDELFKSLRDGDELEEAEPRMFIIFLFSFSFHFPLFVYLGYSTD